MPTSGMPVRKGWELRMATLPPTKNGTQSLAPRVPSNFFLQPTISIVFPNQERRR
jgi:hypothetical protein